MPKVLTPTVRYNLYRIENGEGYVIAIFRYSQGTLRFNPGAKVEVKFWDTKAHRAKYTNKHPEYSDVNQLLNEVENVVMNIYRETKGQLPVEDFRKEIMYRLDRMERPQDEAQVIPTLPEFALKYVEERKDSVAAKRGTWKILQTVANYLVDFVQAERTTLTFQQVDHNFSHRFTNWMYSPPREFSANYAAKVFSVVRQFMLEAKRRKLHQTEDFKEFSIKSEKVTHLALSVEELEHLYNLDLSKNERLERVRDLFLIGCYTGLRYSDFSRIQPQHIIEVEGAKMMEITTQKTGEQVTIPFNPELGHLLNKYHFNPPKMSSQKMNDYLKELCAFAGMTEKILVVTNKAGKREENQVEKYKLITTHVARRSFATNLYLLGVPAINIMKITGHTTERQFMAYIRIDGRLNAQHMAKQIALKKQERYLRKLE
jgi:site-specific recombinase XerD